MKPWLDDGDVRLYLGDCVEVMREMDADSVDAVVCDPPYGLEFMGKDWDRYAPPQFSAWCETWASEALRVLKPGGHLLAFGGTRTFHRLTCGIEDAGFEIRDCLSWLYGSGFPKGLDVSKAIDKAAGAERVVVGAHPAPGSTNPRRSMGDGWQVAPVLTAPATDAAREWQGWGTALKPGYEPAVVARKPHTPQTELAAEAARAEEELCAVVSYAATDTSWSELLRTSGLWSIASSLRECLVDLSTRASTFTIETASSLTTDLAIWRSSLAPITLASITRAPTPEPGMSSAANAAAVLSRSVLLKCERLTATTAGETAIARPVVPGLTRASGLDNPAPAWEPCVVARKPLAGTVAENVQRYGTGAINVDGCRIGTDGATKRGDTSANHATATGWNTGHDIVTLNTGRWPANVALDEAAAAMLDAQGGASRFYYTAKASRADRNTSGANNTHPTVKPTDLMRWLVRLVTPPGGVVLDPFAGSGSTLVAARAEGVRAIGIEQSEKYATIISARLAQLSLFSAA